MAFNGLTRLLMQRHASTTVVQRATSMRALNTQTNATARMPSQVAPLTSNLHVTWPAQEVSLLCKNAVLCLTRPSDSSEICGGSGLISIFTNGQPPPPPPTTNLGVGNWTSLGCYQYVFMSMICLTCTDNCIETKRRVLFLRR